MTVKVIHTATPTTIEGERRRPHRTTLWLWLTAPIAGLLAIAAGGGLFVEGLYHDPPATVAQALGQDVITLAVALPVLVISAILARRGSVRARLVWLGSLTYVVYTYVTYAFGLRFNQLFLIYVAVLGCALYALIGGLVTTDFAAVKARFTERTPVKAVSVFLAVVAGLFYVVWLSEAVPAVLAGAVPQSVIDDGTPTNVVHVVDMAWILPGMLLMAVWLWRKQTIGYALAGALLTFLALLVLAIVAMTVVAMSLYGQPWDPMAAVFGILSALSLGMLVWHLSGVQDSCGGHADVR
jgi:hypothetical protein